MKPRTLHALHFDSLLLSAVMLATGCGSGESDISSGGGDESSTTQAGSPSSGSMGSGTGTGGASESSAGPSGASTTSGGDVSGSTSNTTTAGAATSGAANATTGAGGSATTGADGTSSASSGGASGDDTTSANSTTGGSTGTAGDPVPSAGCEATTTPEEGPNTIDVSGTEREYILRLPDDYDATHPYPIIFAWHGGQYSAEWVDTGGEPQSGPYYGIKERAEGSAIFVAPQALSGSWTNQNGRDLDFVDAMLERFENELCLDESRIFSAGFSMGGIMTATIGCERGDKFRAIAPMSASLRNGCSDLDQPVAYWSSHGTMDTTITPDQGEAVRDVFIARNGCQPSDPAPTTPDGCVSYQGCDPGYPVTWCTFEGIHEPSPYAGEAIWNFFSQF